MSYKSVGSIRKAGCTPAPMTIFDNRSCRERTGCTKECNPKTLKCESCNKMFSSLNVLKDVEANKEIYVCNECERSLMKEK